MIFIVLNKRCSQILFELINQGGAIQISNLAKSFNISSRTVRYDLDNIDYFLKHNKLPQLIRKPNVGIELDKDPKIKQEILKLLENSNNSDYEPSREKRQRLILHELIQQRDYTTINALAENLEVSRGTIINELKDIKSWLEKNNLKLISAPKYGLKVSGDEKQLRHAVMELLTDVEDNSEALNVIASNNSKTTRISMDFNNYINKLFRGIDLDFIESCIQGVEKELNITFSDAAYYGLVIHTAIAVRRIQLGKDIIMPKEDLKTFEGTKEFQMALNMTKMLEEHFNIKIPSDEVGYITLHLLGSNVLTSKLNLQENWLDLQLITNKLIEGVGRDKNMDLSGDRQLFQGLLEHLRPAMYRLRHGLTLKNPIIDEIKSSYPELFTIVKRNIKIIEAFTGKTFSDDEAGYLSMHFGASIERTSSNKRTKVKVLLVCGTGIGTAELLSARLKSMFDIDIVDSVGYHSIREAIKTSPVDLIISTIDIKYPGMECIRVNPLMTEEDIKKVAGAILSFNPINENRELDRLLAIINRNCSILKHDDLIKELSDFLNIKPNKIERGVVQPVLKDLLNENTIEINVEAKTWEEAVKAGGGLLEKDGAVEHKYIEAMINTVKEIGPYIVIAPGIAMPHARPEDGVKKIGLSLLTLKNPVSFGNRDNDPVKIVISLCAVDHSTHLKALSQLVAFLQDNDFISTVLNARGKDEILSYINSKKEEE